MESGVRAVSVSTFHSIFQYSPFTYLASSIFILVPSSDDLAFTILDECYFISSYKTILENIGSEESALKESLSELLNEQRIDQLHFNQKTNDYDRLDSPDVHSIEKSFFVATKKGLLWHNAR